MTKTTGKTARNRKERRAGLWLVSLIVTIQVVGLVLFSMGSPGPVEAKTFVVNSTEDETDAVPGDEVCESASGKCTLRAAIQEANWLDGPDTIKLSAGLYMLTIPGKEDFCASGDLDILSDGVGNDDLTIIGMGAKKTFINGGKLDRVFHILSPVSVTIAKVTIQNGLATEGGLSQALGGGILMTPESTLTIKECIISNNAASHTVEAYGGGIYNNEGTLKIINSTFWNNSAWSGVYSWGGGVYSRQGVLSITRSNLSDNSVSGGDSGYGGGICIWQGVSTTITQSTLSNNSASGGRTGERTGAGGGIYSFDGPLTITNSSFSNNSASGEFVGRGGAISNDSNVTTRTLAITNSNLSNNSASGGSAFGGGLDSGFAEVTIRSSTLSQNAASGRSGTGLGGGIYTTATLTVRNESKIIRNFASDEGGGIWHGGLGPSISADSTVSKNIPDDIYSANP